MFGSASPRGSTQAVPIEEPPSPAGLEAEEDPGRGAFAAGREGSQETVRLGGDNIHGIFWRCGAFDFSAPGRSLHLCGEAGRASGGLGLGQRARPWFSWEGVFFRGQYFGL